MSAPAKPWAELTPAEKNDQVKERIRAGRSYAEIVGDLGAPSRGCIAGVANRLRKKALLPPPSSQKKTGAAGGALTRIRARKKRERVKPVIFPPQPKPLAAEITTSVEPISLLPTAPQSLKSLIDSFIAANGVRRFERGVSEDIIHIKNFAADRGFEILFTQRGFTPYTIKGPSGRSRSVSRAGLFAFVDDLRIADGLEPFIPRKETAHGTRA